MTALINPQVDFYFEKAGKWQQEITRLRTIILDCGFTEELKWGVPCYTFAGDNVMLIHTFKAYCAVLFFKGALINDTHNLLIQQTKNVQAARQMRFTSELDVVERQKILTNYIAEAIAAEKAGLKVALKDTTEFDVPLEFQLRLANIPALKPAFEALTPGRQRAYLLHFAAPKQAKTREARVEKLIPQILAGKGLND